MFVAAGQPGDVKKVQASVATARKVFRIMRVSTQQRQISCVVALHGVLVLGMIRMTSCNEHCACCPSTLSLPLHPLVACSQPPVLQLPQPCSCAGSLHPLLHPSFCSF